MTGNNVSLRCKWRNGVNNIRILWLVQNRKPISIYTHDDINSQYRRRNLWLANQYENEEKKNNLNQFLAEAHEKKIYLI